MVEPMGFSQGETIVYKLGSIESDIRSIKDTLEANERAQNEEINSLKGDVSKLKQERYFLLGAASAISIISSFILKVFL